MIWVEEANKEFCKVARIVLEDLVCPNRMYFTTDEVWRFLTHGSGVEKRAMGSVMLKAARDGLIQKTGGYKQSQRAECHLRPIPIWYSKIYGGK